MKFREGITVLVVALVALVAPVAGCAASPSAVSAAEANANAEANIDALDEVVSIADILGGEDLFLDGRRDDSPAARKLREVLRGDRRHDDDVTHLLRYGIPHRSAHVRADVAWVLAVMDLDLSRVVVRGLLHDDSASVRLHAGCALLDYGVGAESRPVPFVLKGLRSQSQAERTLAVFTLRGFSDEDFGFDAADPADQRAAAVAKWRAWWDAFRVRPRSGEQQSR